MRVLLVEDNQRLNSSLKAGLEEDGYAVDATFDGDEGESFALSAPYDVIILDVMLPKKDGFTLCRDLRQQGIGHPYHGLGGEGGDGQEGNGAGSAAGGGGEGLLQS